MGASNVIREIRRSTRRRVSPEEKIRVVVGGLRGEISVSALCRRGGHCTGGLLPLVEVIP